MNAPPLTSIVVTNAGTWQGISELDPKMQIHSPQKASPLLKSILSKEAPSSFNVPLSPTSHTAATSRDSEFFALDVPSVVPKRDTLYKRLGGKAMVDRITHEFFVEIGGEPSLFRFFDNVPIQAIKIHQGKFFKVLFDVEEERPSTEELLDYMIVTHVRLFRDLGLNATHFDIVGDCFVRSMKKLGLGQDLLDECLEIIGPLRVAFDYGATVAEEERDLPGEKMQTLPHATMKTLRTSQQAVLPPGLPSPPDWLVERVGSREKLRAWTCELTTCFTVEDEVLADIFLGLPYLDMEPYLHKFLQLAFAPSGIYRLPNAHSLLLSVRFPLGITRAAGTQLTKILFERMVGHFVATSNRLFYPDTAAATERLRTVQTCFVGNAPARKVSGFSTPHRLNRLRNDSNGRLADKSNKENELRGNPKETKKKNSAWLWRRLLTGRRRS